jgi:hypothetical protein
LSLLRHAIAAPSRVAASTGLSQDNIIFAMVLFSFVVWITTKGELGKYLSFFTPVAGKQGPVTDPVTPSPTTGGNTSSPAVNNAVGSINNAINSNPVGAAITGLTGTNPLTVTTTPGGIASTIMKWFGH